MVEQDQQLPPNVRRSGVNACFRGGGKRLASVGSWRCPRSSAAALGVLLFLHACLAPEARAVLTNPASPLSVVCDFDPPQFESVGDETRVSIAGCETWERVGEPRLPFRTVRLLLPPASTVAGVAVQAEAAPAQFAGDWRVEWGRTPIRFPRTGISAAPPLPPDPPDPAIYHSDESFPPTAVEVASVQRMGGYDIAFVRVFPIQYAPRRGQVTFTSRLRVTISVAAIGQPPTALASVPGAARVQRDVAALVDNPGLLTTSGDRAVLTGPSPPIFDYLLITKSGLVAAFEPLIQRKALDGLAVKVETVESIGASQAGRDLQEKIRNYIRYAFTNWGITYVLLGGDTSVVPARHAYAYMAALEFGRFPRHLPACDLYYACLDGSWDHDGDGIFGEPTDGEGGGEVDLLAEVYVGRAPVDTVAEVNTFVEKTVRYETQAHARITNVLFVAEYLGAVGGVVAQGWDMFVPLTNYFAGYEQARLDDSPFTTPQWSYLDALRELNRSPHLALFAGHGDPSTLMGLIPDDLDALTNAWPSLTYSVSCDAGAFDNDHFLDPFDCVGEELVKRNAHAAFAAILNSREGWFDAQAEWRWSGEFQIKFFEELLGKGQTRLGVANQLSKHSLISKVETGGLMTYRFCMFEITLFGDPHVALQVPARTASLAVASAHGGASPPVGTMDHALGGPVTCAVTNSPLSGGVGTQYVCTGWSGTGSVPASGTGTQVSFTLSTNSQLTWTWKTQVWFAVSAGGGGDVSAASGWRDLGASLLIQATASNYHHFVRWTGDVPAGAQSNATLNLTMSQPRAVVAAFAANVTSHGTPEWWLADYGWTNQFEAASLADADDDGLPAWAEFIAGTSPVDASSALRASLTSAAGAGSGRVLRWPSAANRWYSVHRADTPNGVFVRLTNGIPGIPPMNTFTDSTAGAAGFYRIGVTNHPP